MWRDILRPLHFRSSARRLSVHINCSLQSLFFPSFLSVLKMNDSQSTRELNQPPLEDLSLSPLPIIYYVASYGNDLFPPQETILGGSSVLVGLVLVTNSVYSHVKSSRRARSRWIFDLLSFDINARVLTHWFCGEWKRQYCMSPGHIMCRRNHLEFLIYYTEIVLLIVSRKRIRELSFRKKIRR